MNFISVTGMLEMIFIDSEGAASAIGGRPVPGALTYTLIEGFILQTMIQGTGLAMLEMTQKILAPVRGAGSLRAARGHACSWPTGAAPLPARRVAHCASLRGATGPAITMFVPMSLSRPMSPLCAALPSPMFTPGVLR